MSTVPEITTARSVLKILGAEDAGLMLAYYEQNMAHLAPWDPKRSPGFYTLPHWQKFLQANREMADLGTGYRFSALNPERTEVLGICNFNNIVRGAFQACHLGYSIAEQHQGSGLMQEILSAGIGYMFKEIGLHRVMANYQPSNLRSAQLLKRLGFEQEGFAKAYLMIDGEWRDHVLNALINPKQ